MGRMGNTSKTVGVIGCGRVGSVIAAVAASRGHQVLVDDKIKNLCHMLAARKAPFPNEPGMQELLEHGHVDGSIMVKENMAECDVIFVIVNTPSNDDGSFSDEYLREVLEDDGGLPDKPWVVVVSTVSPGTMDKYKSRYRKLAYCPAFIAQGSIINDFDNPSLLLVGCDTEWREEAPGEGSDLISCLHTVWNKEGVPALHVMRLQEAELVKIAINGYLTTKISFGIRIAEHCRRHNLNPAVVLDAIGEDKRIGKQLLRPGGTFGGPCLPRDTNALAHAVPGLSSSMQYNRLTNEELIDSVAKRAINAAMTGEPIGVIGLTYKPGIDMTVESFGKWVADRIEFLGGEAKRYDFLIGGDISALACRVTVAGLPLPFPTTINVWETYGD